MKNVTCYIKGIMFKIFYCESSRRNFENINNLKFYNNSCDMYITLLSLHGSKIISQPQFCYKNHVIVRLLRSYS